ncbi:MAG: ArnT family glycosyltransferase [Chthoniobacterales bacterium]
MEAFPAKSWRNIFLLALALFVVSRALLLSAFPIFNDEAIYLQYAQLMHEHWDANKFISMNNEYHDWKPPLQYWLAAPVIRWGHDPLIAGRAVAALVSLGGFFGFALFARELFGRREGALSALLYALCPPVIFHNVEFIAETFLFSTAPFFYWALLKAFSPNKWRWGWALAAIFFAIAILLFKQSGFLLLAVAIFLPLARARSLDFQLALNFAIAAVVIGGARLLSGCFLPAEFDQIREHFNRHWVMSASEVFAAPLEVWRTNLHLVGDYIGAYYSWLVPLFVIVFCILAWRRRNTAELALALMLITSAGGICFLLRTFNEYLFNTAIVAILLPIFARTCVLIWDFERRGRTGQVRLALLAAAVFVLAFWSYQIVLMRISPARYLERSTPWAVTNYLRGWPTGFAVKEIVALLEKEKLPGVILADAQWGNPRTALEVYAHDRFPKLKIIPVLCASPEPNELSKWAAEVKKRGVPVRLAIFSADRAGARKLWEPEAERVFCTERMEINADPAQMPILVCHF